MSILSAIGGMLGAGLNFLQSNKAAKQQEDFAKNAISYRVADAKNAGIHPIYALGANVAMPSPVAVGDLAGPLANMGASIDDVVNKRRTAQADSAASKLEALTLERASLENDHLRAQIRKMNSPGLPPALVTSGDLALPLGNRQSLPFTPGPSSTAQRVQDEYGDIAENVYGTSRAVTDISDNLLSRTGVKDLLNWYFSERGMPKRNAGFPRFGGRR